MTAGCGDYPVWAAALARRSSTLPERLAPPSYSAGTSGTQAARRAWWERGAIGSKLFTFFGCRSALGLPLG